MTSTTTSWTLLVRPHELVAAHGCSQGVEVLRPVPVEPDLHQVRAELAQQLQSHGYQGESVLLALHACQCLSATFPYDRHAMGRDPQALAFALEDYLPLPLEQWTADFSVVHERALGVAVVLQSLRPLLDVLGESGIYVQSIVPTIMLVAQSLARSMPMPRDYLFCCDGSPGVDLLVVQQGRPVVWRHSRGSHAIGRELAMISPGTMPGATFAYGVEETVLAALRAACRHVEAVPPSESLESHAVPAAARVLRLQEDPWVELRRGSLGNPGSNHRLGKRAQLFLAATLGLLVSMVVSFQLLGRRYDQRVDSLVEEQVQLFRDVFPNQEVPVGIRSRLESELLRRQGASGQQRDAPQLGSALARLHQVLLAVPSDLRVRLLEIRLEDNKVYLEGQVPRHGDAELLAEALRHAGLQVDVPRTEALADSGVSMTLICRDDSTAAKKSELGR